MCTFSNDTTGIASLFAPGPIVNQRLLTMERKGKVKGATSFSTAATGEGVR
jgi:hypothetical protein